MRRKNPHVRDFQRYVGCCQQRTSDINDMMDDNQLRPVPREQTVDHLLGDVVKAPKSVTSN
jgi:hypothetical protein